MGCQALEQAAQGRGGVTIPGRGQRVCGCGIWRHGLVVNTEGISEVFSNLNYSVILWQRHKGERNNVRFDAYSKNQLLAQVIFNKNLRKNVTAGQGPAGIAVMWNSEISPVV